MQKVYDISFRKQIEGESVPNEDKLFSIYEHHTDIIMKGSRVPLFGHKINLAAGKSNLIMDCKVLKGNPADKTLYQTTINSIISNYRIIPRDSTTDGGYASIKNQQFALLVAKKEHPCKDL